MAQSETRRARCRSVGSVGGLIRQKPIGIADRDRRWLASPDRSSTTTEWQDCGTDAPADTLSVPLLHLTGTGGYVHRAPRGRRGNRQHYPNHRGVLGVGVQIRSVPSLGMRSYRPLALFCRRMMPARARNESFTVSALGNTFATSASSTTTFVPCA